MRGGALARGLNLNAPVDGVRPDPRFGNVIEVVSDASSRQHQLQTNLTVNQGALFPLSKSAPRVSFKRVTLFFNYTLGQIPQQHRRRVQRRAARRSGSRVGAGQQRRAASAEHQRSTTRSSRTSPIGINVNAASGAPYTLRTGLRRQRRPDLQRSAGRRRPQHRARRRRTSTLNLNLGYGWTFGPPAGGPPGIGVFVGRRRSARGAHVRSAGALPHRRASCSAQNLTNRANYIGYSGVMTSPFFRQPTAVTSTRRVEAGLNFGF